MLSINTNSPSLIIQRNLTKETNGLNTALERMSTGYKVNRAKDDAANMQISESLTVGINASKILKNGSSMALDMLNTTESALSDMTNSLLRIRDLTLQKMNSVYDENALDAMNKEIQAQIDNIIQISKKTEFNGKKLLDGTVKDMLIPLYDDGNSGLEGIDMTELFSELDFIDILTGEKNMYFVEANAGEKYYANFEDKIFEITSDRNQQIIYRYDSATSSIEFIDCEGAVSTQIGNIKNDYSSLGTGEQYIQIEANRSCYISSGNKVYELKNTNAISQIAIYKEDGAGGLDLLTGSGIQKNELYELDTYNSISSGQTLQLNAGSTQHIVFSNKLYEISSAKNQTLIFNNVSGNLNVISGQDGVTISSIGNMKQGVTTGLASYTELNANETKYYEYNGNIFKIQNNKSTKQNFILDANNNIMDGNGNVSRTQLSTTSIKDFSSYTNLQSMSVTAGNDYYLQNPDGSGITKITANQNGVTYFDKTSGGYNKFQGVSVTSTVVSNYEAVTPDASNQFSLSVQAGETKYISLNNQIYTVKNDTGADFTKKFEYNSSSKTVKEVTGSTGAASVNGTYISDFSSSTSQTASNLRYIENLSGTSYFEFGDDIYEIKNNGATQDVFFDYNSATGALSLKNATNIELKKVNKADFNSLNNNNFSTQFNPGETQYMAFTINGVQRVYKVTNNSSDSQSVVFEKTNNVTVKSGNNVVIEEYTDMTSAEGVAYNSFYIDFAGESKKNINRYGMFYEITNNAQTTAIFRQSGNSIIQYSGSTTSNTSKMESYGMYTAPNQYSIELDANEKRYINIGDLTFELNNNSSTKQTEIFTSNGTTLFGLNPYVSSTNLPLSNSPMQQMLIKTDWALSEISSRRSQLGAYGNAIDASIRRNTNVEINLTAAKSTIMDADIAQESCTFVQNQILQNVSSSLLLQANTMKRDIILRLIT